MTVINEVSDGSDHRHIYMYCMYMYVYLSMAVIVGTDRGSVQLWPRDVHSCRSSSFRLSCSRDTAELVRAGLITEAPRPGPPVVFTICTHPDKTKLMLTLPFRKDRPVNESLMTAGVLKVYTQMPLLIRWYIKVIN